jgi:hypothetical protein
VWDESSASNADVTVIPSQLRVTQQILSHWQPFQDLKLMFAVSRRAEQSSLYSQQHIVATVEDSVLRTEMAGLESQEEDDPIRILFFKPMSWLGQIRSHRRDETWSAGLWQTFFSASMGAQIPVIEEKPLATCGCWKFQLDPLGDHLNTCTVHSGAKKAHDWMVDQVADLFRTTHKVKTQQVVKIRGQNCGDIELAGYLANESGPVQLVLDLRIAHDRVGSSTDPSLNGHLLYPINLDQSLNYAYRLIGKLTAFFVASGVQLAQLTSGQFHFRRAAFSQQFKSKVGLVLAKAGALRINLNLDGAPITSKSHTHPSHSQTSRLSTSSLSLGAPVPRPTQCQYERRVNLLVCSLPSHRHSYIGFIFSFRFIDS